MRHVRLGVASIISLTALALAAPVAGALSTGPSDTLSMFDAQVRAIYPAGGSMWVGGGFTHVLSSSGATVGTAVAIAALNPTTGTLAAGVSAPELGGRNAIIYDFSLGANGVLYVAGKFTYSANGKSGRNLMGINPVTGAIVVVANTQELRAVFATSNRVLTGGSTLEAFSLTGSPIGSFNDLTAWVDDSLRSHSTPAQFRDIGMSGGEVIAVGQFDEVNGNPQKVAVKFNPDTGQVASWHLGGMKVNSAAFGIEMEISGTTLFVAAGGSDFTAAYRISTGQQIWKTDTSGSSQTVAMLGTDALVVGGHFDWVALTSGQQCGDNASPNKSCLNQPKLTSLSALTGKVDSTWRPSICCLYNGVWGTATYGGKVYVGGEFTKVGSRTQKYIARFS